MSNIRTIEVTNDSRHSGRGHFARLNERDLTEPGFYSYILGNCQIFSMRADVVKLADTPDLGSGTERCGGSSPLVGTNFYPSYFKLF